jgi:proline iminopeptidase
MRMTWSVVGLVLLIAWGAVAQENVAAQAEPELFPVPVPFQNGYLKVDGLHEIYYELCGNPEGSPIMVLHGGPGVGMYDRLKQYYDPQKFLIALHDQRGAGRSRPAGELRENTTPRLVEDIEQLRRHLDLGPVYVFGGSWGSTLALAYAETYPGSVRGMILRGIFDGSPAVVDFHYEGAAFFFPQEHATLLHALPDPERRPLPPYLEELLEQSDPHVTPPFLDALARYELKMGSLQLPDEAIDQIMAGFPSEMHHQMSSIDLYYVSHGYFLEPGQLLRNVDRLTDIPITFINGRYDIVCPPLIAYRLYEKLPRSELIVVEAAGHSEREPGITAALLRAVARWD